MEVRKTGESFKCYLISHTSRRLEDSGVKICLKCGGLGQWGLEKRNINIWPRDFSCSVFLKNVTAFWPLSEEAI